METNSVAMWLNHLRYPHDPADPCNARVISVMYLHSAKQTVLQRLALEAPLCQVTLSYNAVDVDCQKPPPKKKTLNP